MQEPGFENKHPSKGKILIPLHRTTCSHIHKDWNLTVEEQLTSDMRLESPGLIKAPVSMWLSENKWHGSGRIRARARGFSDNGL